MPLDDLEYSGCKFIPLFTKYSHLLTLMSFTVSRPILVTMGFGLFLSTIFFPGKENGKKLDF